MESYQALNNLSSRRTFLQNGGMGLGVAALSSILAQSMQTAQAKPLPTSKAKRVIYLFMSGEPSQEDLKADKPEQHTQVCQ